MIKRPLPTAEQVRAVIDYDPDTGLFTWRFRPELSAKFNSRFAGKPAGTVTPHGYIAITIDHRQHRANRLAWLIVTGEWPALYVDHENRNRADNRWLNLRLATTAQNAANQKPHVDNSSGVKGVRWHKVGRCWVAQIGHQGRMIHLGSFDSIEKAKAAYEAAARQLQGAFALSK